MTQHLPFSAPPLVGLLGGSFNPAHAGHRYISEVALQRLGLDAMWWLVSPHNPLKRKQDLAAYDHRMESARRAAAGNPRIWVSGLEETYGLRYTIDTVRFLIKRYPQTRFVWIMGADNLLHFHRWQEWRALLHLLPVVVMDRLPEMANALSSRAALTFAHSRCPAPRLRRWWLEPLPCWGVLRIRPHPGRATEIRKLLHMQWPRQE